MAKLSEQLLSGAVSSAPSGKTKLSDRLVSGEISSASKPTYIAREKSVLPTTKESNVSKMQSYSDPSRKLTSDEKKEVKDAYKALKQYGVEKNTQNQRDLWKKAIDSGEVDADYADAVINAYNKASAEGAAYDAIVGLGSTFAKPVTALSSAIEKLSGSGKTNWQEANKNREEALSKAQGEHKIATGAGQLAGSMVQYNAVNGVLGEGAKLSTRLLQGQAADTILDTIPEIANNYAQGKYVNTDGSTNGKELAKDVLKNQATNLAFNVGGEALGAIIPKVANSIKAKKLSETLKEASETATDTAKQTTDTVKEATDTVKETTDTVKEATENVAPDVEEVVKETTSTLTNKQIDNIITDPVQKKAWEEANGIKLSGTKAEQRKQIKDFINGTSDNATNASKTMAEDAGLGKEASETVNKKVNPDPATSGERQTADDIADDILKRKDSNHKTKTSKVGKNKFDANDPDEIARKKSGFYDYLESSEKETVEKAKTALSEDYDNTFKKLTTSNDDVLKTYEDSDVDAGFILADRLKRLRAEALEQGNTELANKIAAQIDMVKGNLRKAGTEFGRGVQAYRKWTDTASGAITNGERVLAKKTESWAKTNVKKAKKVADMAEKIKSSAAIDTAFKNMGNDNIKAKYAKEAVPKTHQQIVSEVKASIEKEFGSISDKFTENDIEYLANLVENKVPSWQITDELTQRLANGKFYSLDESTPVKKQIENRLKGILNQISNDAGNTAKEAKDISHLEYVERVKNTMSDEYASLTDDFTDADYDYLANLIENNISTDQLKEMLQTRIANGTWGVSQATVDKVNELFDLAALKDVNSKERVELESKAYATIAEDIYKNGGTFFEKFDEWRYLAMLGNPKTHIRNVTSNIIFSGVTSASNTLAATMEGLVDKVAKKISGNGIERTKSVLNVASDADRKLISGAYKDAEEGAYRQLSGSSRYFENASASIESQRKIFKSKLMRAVDSANSNALEFEDFATMRTKYSTSLAGYLKANGVDDTVFEAERRLRQLQNSSDIPSVTKEISDLQKQVDVLNKGREYAIKQAEYTAFHEDNAFATLLKNLTIKARESDKIGINLIGRAVEGVMPFAKTPANILRSGVEYSPLNAIKNVADIKKVVKGSMSASEYIEGLSKTLTGTGLFATGLFLYNKGLLSTGSDETTGKFDSNQGKQAYAIKLGGKTYTVDFAVPAVMAVLVGAEVGKILKKSGYDDAGDFFEVMETDGFDEAIKNIDLNEVINSAIGIADPITETSMLSGVNDTLKSIQYGDGGALGTLAANTLTGYVTQGVPTLMGQVARSMDNTRRSTYTQNTGAVGQVERQINKITNKIPGLSQKNEAYIDLWGRETPNYDGSALGNVAYQFASPSYIDQVNETDVDKELQKLYDATKESSVLPSPQGYTVDEKRLSEKDYHDYAQKVGQTRYSMLDEIIKSSEYQNATDEEKVKYVSDIYTLANQIGKYYITGKENTSGLFKAYQNGGMGEALDYLKKKVAFDSAGVSISTKAANEAYDADGVEGLQAYAEISNVLTQNGLTYSKKNANLYEEYGEEALVIQKEISGLESKKAENLIPVLDSYDISDYEKGQLIANNVSTSKAVEDYGDDYEKIYEIYKLKSADIPDANKDGKVNKYDKIQYLYSLGYNQTQTEELIPYLN